MSRRFQGARMSRRMPGGAIHIPDPPDVFGSALEVWLRSDLGITITGSGVSTWADQSGKGDANRNSVQTSDAARPTYTTADSGYNGMPSLTFDGANQFMTSALFATDPAQPYFLAAVGQDSGAAATQIYVEAGSDLSGTNRVLLYQNTNNYEIFAGNALMGGARGSAKRVLAGFVNGGSSALYNSAKTPASGNAGANGPFGGYFLGQTFAATARLNGKLVEVVLASGTPTTAQIDAFLDYAGRRYNITIGA